MKAFLVGFWLLWSPFLIKADPVLSSLLMEIRTQLPQAFEEEQVCEALLLKANQQNIDAPVLKGYVGALHLAKSKHVSIFKKMQFFNKGVALLEEAISKASENVELRFLRLTIQINLPGFLGYSDKISTDKSFVIKNYHQALPILKKRIINFARQSTHFSEKDKAHFQ